MLSPEALAALREESLPQRNTASSHWPCRKEPREYSNLTPLFSFNPLPNPTRNQRPWGPSAWPRQIRLKGHREEWKGERWVWRGSRSHLTLWVSQTHSKERDHSELREMWKCWWPWTDKCDLQQGERNNSLEKQAEGRSWESPWVFCNIVLPDTASPCHPAVRWHLR